MWGQYPDSFTIGCLVKPMLESKSVAADCLLQWRIAPLAETDPIQHTKLLDCCRQIQCRHFQPFQLHSFWLRW